MALEVDIRNESARKGLVRRDVLQRLGQRICEGEGIDEPSELSVLFCDDPAMRELNRAYRKEDMATDVLSFPQTGPGDVRILGDIVISLETVEQRHPDDKRGMRDEVKLLFCHGMLHLLGYDHHNETERKKMTAKQAVYLDNPEAAAWPAAKT